MLEAVVFYMVIATVIAVLIYIGKVMTEGVERKKKQEAKSHIEKLRIVLMIFLCILAAEINSWILEVVSIHRFVYGIILFSVVIFLVSFMESKGKKEKGPIYKPALWLIVLYSIVLIGIYLFHMQYWDILFSFLSLVIVLGFVIYDIKKYKMLQYNPYMYTPRGVFNEKSLRFTLIIVLANLVRNPRIASLVMIAALFIWCACYTILNLKVYKELKDERIVKQTIHYDIVVSIVIVVLTIIAVVQKTA